MYFYKYSLINTSYEILCNKLFIFFLIEFIRSSNSSTSIYLPLQSCLFYNLNFGKVISRASPLCDISFNQLCKLATTRTRRGDSSRLVNFISSHYQLHQYSTTFLSLIACSQNLRNLISCSLYSFTLSS